MPASHPPAFVPTISFGSFCYTVYFGRLLLLVAMMKGWVRTQTLFLKKHAELRQCRQCETVMSSGPNTPGNFSLFVVVNTYDSCTYARAGTKEIRCE